MRVEEEDPLIVLGMIRSSELYLNLDICVFL